MTVAQFLEAFPEFAEGEAPTELVQAKLDEASRQLDQAVLGTRYADALGYLAADLLARSPFGQQARLVEQERGTTYETAWRRIVRLSAAGPLVA